MNKIPASFILFIAMATFLLYGGCDKENDTEFPEIAVALPNLNSIFDNGDTIRFEATISDNNKLNTIEIILVDMDNKPMLANISLIPGENPFVFKGDYIIDDPMLPGGIYQLRFRASDGVNVTNYFVKIQIHELEQQMLYPVIVTHPEDNKWQAYRLNNGLDWQEIYTHNGDYSGSAVNSPASQLYMCGKFQSDLTAVRLPDGLPLWHVKPGIHQSERWFEAVSYTHPLLYVSCAEGNIRGYDKTGSELYKSGSQPNSFPGLTVVTENLIICSFMNSFSNERSLVAFHNQGGLMIHNKFIQLEVVSMLLLDKDLVLVFGNINGQGIISLYNGTDNTLADIHPFYEGTFNEAAVMDTDNFLVSASNGLFWFSYSKNSLAPFVSGCINCQVACDNSSRLVYACSGKKMGVYSFPFASQVDSITLPDKAVDLHLVFNK